MTTVVTAHQISKRYGRTSALDGITFSLQKFTIYGLLGRNGAGKTTLMQILTGQGFATSGTVEVFGGAPYEDDAVLADVCFVKESQRYPDSFTVRHALRAAGLLFPQWDEDFAQSLVDDFGLPRKRRVKKLSRGMASALGVIIGLASRARLTLFDEPYLGLDAVARQLFYDRLLADYGSHPRTVVLSTHLIDEVGDLIEHVLLLDQGRLIVNAAAETLRGQAVTLIGPVDAVEKFLAGPAPQASPPVLSGRAPQASPGATSNAELHREQMGATARVTVQGGFVASDRVRAEALGLQIKPVSLQQLVVLLTSHNPDQPDKETVR